MAYQPITITECPRDAMQGIEQFIPTRLKTAYINQLLQVGFDTIDFGSFVSPKAIPQMQDTAQVLAGLDLTASRSKLLAIVANYRGAEVAAKYPEITYLGFPFSISETFQRRNANSGINEAFEAVVRIRELCAEAGKQLLVYLSMGFGNPYGDIWNAELVLQWTAQLVEYGIEIIALSDTIGIASPAQINEIYPLLMANFPGIEFGVHLHATPSDWHDKIDAAWKSGCRRFDTAIRGFGGCPMAEDRLTGNIATENLAGYLQLKGEQTGLDMDKLRGAMEDSAEIFG